MSENKPSSSLPEELYPKLSEEQIAQLSKIGTRRSLPAGELIFDQGAVGRNFYVVLKGALEALIPTREGENRVHLHTAGDFTGERLASLS